MSEACLLVANRPSAGAVKYRTCSARWSGLGHAEGDQTRWCRHMSEHDELHQVTAERDFLAGLVEQHEAGLMMNSKRCRPSSRA
ncbi:hypothetical protein CDO09_18335 [Xanthomonas perforans]|nr:hypothetical protein Xvtw_19815 [Xanthomonas campestris pv. vitiswoodrowii]PWH22075.1 hypothetical protein CDO09_18335 [Xanthomonas perforans]